MFVAAQKSTLVITPQSLSALVFEAGSLTGPEYTIQTRLAGPWVPGIHLFSACLLFFLWDYQCLTLCLAFEMWASGIELSSLCLQGMRFISWAIFSISLMLCNYISVNFGFLRFLFSICLCKYVDLILLYCLFWGLRECETGPWHSLHRPSCTWTWRSFCLCLLVFGITDVSLHTKLVLTFVLW